jgi:hypothetical protein
VESFQRKNNRKKSGISQEGESGISQEEPEKNTEKLTSEQIKNFLDQQRLNRNNNGIYTFSDNMRNVAKKTKYELSDFGTKVANYKRNYKRDATRIAELKEEVESIKTTLKRELNDIRDNCCTNKLKFHTIGQPKRHKPPTPPVTSTGGRRK